MERMGNSDKFKTLVLKESLEDINLYVAEFESTIMKLSEDVDDENYLMLKYKLQVLEAKMAEINNLLINTLNLEYIGKKSIS